VNAAPTMHMRVRTYSTGNNDIELSVSAARRTHQSQRTTMKQLVARNGTVHPNSKSHGVDQPGHALGGLTSSNTASVEADRSKAIKVTMRAKFIVHPYQCERMSATGPIATKMGCPREVRFASIRGHCRQHQRRRKSANGRHAI
jgi:hypothetical protein